MPKDPQKTSVFDKYEVPTLDFNFQPDTTTMDPGLLGDEFAPQSEESRRFEEEWNQKGAGEKLRTGIKAGWEQAKGGLKYAGAELMPMLLSAAPGGIANPDYHRANNYDKITDIKESAQENFDAMPEGKGMLYETGMFIPQMAGTALALAAAPATGGTSLSAVPGIIGTLNSAALGGMVLGTTLHEYDQYTAEKGIQPKELTRWGVALGAAAAEFAAEKIRVAQYLPDGLVGKMAGKAFKVNPNKADDMMRSWAMNDPKMYAKFKKFIATTATQSMEEGLEEAGTEFVQSYLNNIYLNPEDRLDIEQIGQNAAHAFRGGAMMGGMIGPMSYTSNKMYHNMRQKRNGVTLVETKEGKVFEYLGPDRKDGGMATVMDSQGNVSSIKSDVVKQSRTMTGPELKEYLNVYRDTQDGLPEMEDQLKRNMARQQIDKVGQSIMFSESESPEIRIGKRRDDGKMVYIRSSFEDKPGEIMHVVVDAETMEKSLVPDQEIETGMIQNYETWAENETEELMGTIGQAEQAQQAGDEIEQAIKDEEGVQEFHQGEKVLYMNREWLIREKGVDGTLVMEPISADGIPDTNEGPIELNPEETVNVAKYVPVATPSQDAEKGLTAGESTERQVTHEASDSQDAQESHPQARKIDDGKNEYEVLDGEILEKYTIARKASAVAKKLQGEYPGLVFNVQEYDDGDPFNKNEYTITVDVAQQQTEEVAEEAIQEEVAPVVDESAAVEEMSEIAPEVTQEELAPIINQEEEEVTTTLEQQPEEVTENVDETPKEVNAEVNPSEEDAYAEIEGFLPEPVTPEEDDEFDENLPMRDDLIADPISSKFDEENDVRGIANIDNALQEDLITEEEHERGKQLFENELREREQAERESDAAIAEEENSKDDTQSQGKDRKEEQPEVDTQSTRALQSEIDALKQNLTDTRNARQAKKKELDKKLNTQQDMFAGDVLTQPQDQSLFEVKQDGSQENIQKILGEFDNTIARIEQDIDLKEKQLATAKKEEAGQVETLPDENMTMPLESEALNRNLAEGEIITAYGSKEKQTQANFATIRSAGEVSIAGDNYRGRDALRRREEAAKGDEPNSGSINKVKRRTVLEGFKEKGYVDFSGVKISSPQDVADLFSIHRSPHIEKSHAVFVKDNVIVGTTAVTSNYIAATNLPDTGRILRLYAKYRADGVYLLHNHPSGNHYPSASDVNLTVQYNEEFKRYGANLIGHVIIDTDKFSYIDLKEKPFIGNKVSVSDLNEYVGQVKELEYKNAVPKLFSEREVLPKDEAAQVRMLEIGKAILSDKGYKGAFFYLMNNLSLSAYDVFPDGATSEDIAGIAREGLLNNLGSKVILVHDGSYEHDLNISLPKNTLDLINTEAESSEEFKTDRKDIRNLEQTETLWDRPRNYKPAFAGDVFNANDYSEYIQKAKDNIGEKSSDWIKGAVNTIAPEQMLGWLREKESFYGGSPRISNRIKRAIKHVEENPAPGIDQKKVSEGEMRVAGPPENLINSKGQKFRRMAQDRSLAIRELQNRVIGLGGKITEYSNPYRQENLSHGAVKAAIEDYDKLFIDPLLDTISEIQKATGMDYKQINEYMMAKHAPERNDALKKESGSDVNAGMTTDDAKAITLKYESKMPREKVDKLWKQINSATRYALQRNLEDGYISNEMYDKLTGPEGYKHYVPMRGWAQSEADDLFEYFQSDVSKAVNPFRAAKGRKSLADDPLQYIVNMAHTAIVMGEKNRVKQHLSSLVRGNKNLKDKDNKPLFWFKKVYYVWDGTYDSDGKKNYTEHIEKPPKNLWDDGKVEAKFNGDHMRRRSVGLAKEHEVEVWIGGEKHAMVLPADVAAAVNKTPSRWDNSAYALQSSIGKITRWLSANFTSKNPAFIPVNQIRDLQYAFWAHAIKGEKGDLGKFMKAIPSARGAINRSLKGKADMSNNLDMMYRDFRLNGGETGYIHMQDVDQLAKNLKKDLKRLNRKNISGRIASKVYFGAGEMLEHWAIRSENLSRFATYISAIKAGKSPKQAAQEAKDITVNFNRAGLSAGVTGSLYAFFNAGIQGGHNAMKMAKDNPGKIAFAGAGMTAMGFLTAMFAHLWAGDDDDDTVNDYEEMNDYHKYNNLTIPVPGKDKFVTIPLPHFFRFFNAVGVLAYQTIVTDEKTTGEAVANGVSSLASSISPVNPVEFFEQGTGLGGTIRPFTPTALVPGLDILTNTDFAGNRIRREPFTSSMAGRVANSQLGQNHVNRYLKWTTDQLFKAGGGDPEAGSKFYMDQDGMLHRVNDLMDINPSNLEHIFEYYLGGRGRFWNNVLKTGEGVIKGAAETVMGDREFREMLTDVNSNNTPVFRRFYTQPWQNSIYTRYYDIINEMDDYKSFIRSQAKAREGVDMDDLMDPYHDNVDYELKYLRKDLDYIDEDIELM